MHPTKLTTAQTGFTLVELVIVIIILGIISATILPRFISVSDEAEQAVVDAVYGALVTGEQFVKTEFYLQGSPGLGVNANVTVMFEGIPVRFRNGQIRTTLNSNHVPAFPVVPQNRGAAYTRLFFLFLANAPGTIVARNSPDRGWAMLGNNNTCAPGPNPRRCWEYRSNGARVARITYYSQTGTFLKD